MSSLNGPQFDPNELPFFLREEALDPGKRDFHRFAVEVAADEVFLMRDDSQIVYVNQSACKRLGYREEELVGKFVWEWDPLFPASVWPGFWEEFVQHRHLHFETRHMTKQGDVFPVEIHAHYYECDGAPHLLAFVNDLSVLKKLEEEKLTDLTERNDELHEQTYQLAGEVATTTEELEVQAERLRNLWENSPDVYLVIDPGSSEILECNKSAERILCGTREEILHKTLIDFSPPNQVDGRPSLELIQERILEIQTNGFARFDWLHTRLTGEDFWVEVESRSGKLRNRPVLFTTWRDISMRKAMEEDLRVMAHNDQLTGLPNRRLLEEHTNFALERAARNKQPLYLMFIDLDNFKYVNDAYGHKVGDSLLIEAAHRFQSVLRGEDLLARIGGDEFVVVLQDLDGQFQVETVAQKLMQQGNDPVEIANASLPLGMSIGIASYPRDGDDFDQLLSRADTAMYGSKQNGKARYQFYSSEASASASERLRLEVEMRKGLKQGEFRLYYQPKVSLKTGRISGVEALIRWQHPELGLISPASFLPIAEESSLLEGLEHRVFHVAALQAAAWQRMGMKFNKIAVNASGKSLKHGYAAEYLQSALRRGNCPASLLEVEISEGFMMQGSEQGLGEINKIRRLGVDLSLDDFGTGFSSLTYVKKMPISKLKVDQSFVRHISDSSEDREIISATIAMAHKLNLTTIAEGVETEEQLAFLREEQCDEIQGYLLSQPLSPKEFEELYYTRFHEVADNNLSEFPWLAEGRGSFT